MPTARWIAPLAAIVAGHAIFVPVANASPPFTPFATSAACLPLLRPCPAAPAPVRGGEPALALGVTETDPQLISPSGEAAAALAGASDDLAALRPRYVRVTVDWERAQPRAGSPPSWNRGLRERLRAIARRQETDGGWEAVVVPYFTPAWAAAPARGCERDGTRPRARMPRLAAYRALIRSLQALGRETGVRLAHWSPWNEPNHPAFLNPQRARCDGDSPALAPALYASLARAMQAELEPGQELIVGELAGLREPRVHGAGAAEFAQRLPADVACAGTAWAQHAYIGRKGRRLRDGRRADPDPADPQSAAALPLIDSIDRELRAKGCSPPIWLTETGTFDHRCEAMAAALQAWAHDGRVAAAFQYTFREHASFPVGLSDPDLKATYGSYAAWRQAAKHGAENARAGCPG